MSRLPADVPPHQASSEAVSNDRYDKMLRSWTQDPSLTDKEARLLLYLAGRPPGWKIIPEQIANALKRSLRYWVMPTLRLLRARGLIKTAQIRDGSGQWAGTELTIHRGRLIAGCPDDDRIPDHVPGEDVVPDVIPGEDAPEEDTSLSVHQPVTETGRLENGRAVNPHIERELTMQVRTDSSRSSRGSHASPPAGQFEQQTFPYVASVPDPPDDGPGEVIDGEIAEEKPKNAGTLIAAWIDHCATPPPQSITKRVGQRLKKLLEQDGVPYDVVERGLAAWHRSDASVPSIDHFVFQAGKGFRPSSRRASGAERLAQVNDVVRANRTDGAPSAAMTAFARLCAESVESSAKAIGQ